MAVSLSDATVYQYYQKWHGRTFVVELSDNAVDSDGVVGDVLKSLLVLMNHGVSCVLVHGGGGRVTELVPVAGRHPETHLPVTPKNAIPEIRRQIELIATEIAAQCDHLEIQHEVLPHHVVAAERLLGHGETGHIAEVIGSDVQAATRQNKLAIVSCGGVSAAGSFLNVNADLVASETARALAAQKLILLTDSDGIRVRGRGSDKRLNFVDFHRLVRLLRERDAAGELIIDPSMLPKIEACLRAIGGGVGQVHIIKAAGNSILQEVLTRTGIGTLVEYEQVVRIVFPARDDQIDEVIAIRQECSNARTPEGVPYLKPVEPARLRELLGTTACLEHRGVTVGTMYFHPLPRDKSVALLGGLAVGDNHQDSGYGQALVEACLEKVWEAGFRHAFSVTAAEGVKSLFRRYASGTLPAAAEKFVAEAQERYGEEGSLVEAFSFQRPD